MLWKGIGKMFNDTLLRRFAKIVKEDLYRRKWRRKNKHNDTQLRKCSDLSCVEVGKYSYGEINAVVFGNKHKVRIGNFVSIAPNVTFILDAEHYVNTVSSFPFKVAVLNQRKEAFGKGDIIIDDDVWIGYGATILSGVRIHQGAIVAAEAVVTSDVPPYTIVGGVPAKVIKHRFNQLIIDYLLTLDYDALTKEMISDHEDELYKVIDNMGLEHLKILFGWFPKKLQEKQ